MAIEQRPWGSYEILYSEGNDFVIKKLIVAPGQRFSYQTHANRDERWIVVSGLGAVILDDHAIPVQEGSMIEILRTAKHRALNSGTEDLVIIEVITGAYDEEDIVRLADDYGRGMTRG